GPRELDRPRGGRRRGQRVPEAARSRRAAAPRARARGPDGAAGGHRQPRRAGREPLAGATGMTTAYSQSLDRVTRVRGVRGAMLVAGDDGLVIAEQLMEGIKGPAVAALAASLATRLRRAMAAAG